MICGTCHGQRFIATVVHGCCGEFLKDGSCCGVAIPVPGEHPCPDCLGGLQHCCEGDQEQPESAAGGDGQ